MGYWKHEEFPEERFHSATDILNKLKGTETYGYFFARWITDEYGPADVLSMVFDDHYTREDFYNEFEEEFITRVPDQGTFDAWGETFYWCEPANDYRFTITKREQPTPEELYDQAEYIGLGESITLKDGSIATRSTDKKRKFVPFLQRRR